ncbi:hypothetical protein GCM10010405_53940 [Streptomyces macrosporus]|uniref:Transposase n=1 Tax=Streptomyces macrosporus TaxID=44032 RepID=A0ABN3KJ97_9ACTN
MTSENVTEPEIVEPSEPQSAKAVDDRLIDELVGRAQAEGLRLTGEGGLLQQLTKRLLESALAGPAPQDECRGGPVRGGVDTSERIVHAHDATTPPRCPPARAATPDSEAGWAVV